MAPATSSWCSLSLGLGSSPDQTAPLGQTLVLLSGIESFLFHMLLSLELLEHHPSILRAAINPSPVYFLPVLGDYDYMWSIIFKLLLKFLIYVFFRKDSLLLHNSCLVFLLNIFHHRKKSIWNMIWSSLKKPHEFVKTDLRLYRVMMMHNKSQNYLGQAIVSLILH